MKLQFATLLFPAVAVALTACGGNGTSPQPEPDKPVPTGKKEIRISAVQDGTRATDTYFETGDRAGLFVVNWSSGLPGTLYPTGNHVDNMGFTYDGKWTPDTQIFWKDDETKADFYFIYPYREITSVADMPFSVNEDQSALERYKGSDLICGKREGVSPTESAVEISAAHCLSQIKVTLAAGGGFTEDEIYGVNPVVKVNGVRTESTVNLRNFSITPNGDAKSVALRQDGRTFKAYLIPQTAVSGNLITVSLNGRDYNLRKDFTFLSGKSHSFTVTLKKTSNGINVSITSWDDDGIDNGGVAE